MGFATGAKAATRRLPMKEEMLLMHGNVRGPIDNASESDKAYLVMLENNPELARELGAVSVHMGHSFARAYPGQTRTRQFTNEQWTRNGYSYVAAVNRAMGLDCC